MECRRVLLSPLTSIAVWGAGLITLVSCGCSLAQSDTSYIRYSERRDLERRREPLLPTDSVRTIDVSAFAEMPEPYAAAVTKYVEAVCSQLKVEPIKRQRFYHIDLKGNGRDEEPTPYPDHANPIPDQEANVTLVLLPRPEVVSKWANSPAAEQLGWRMAPAKPEQRGTVYGRTIIFEPGKRSINPDSVPAAPVGTSVPSWDLYVSDYDTSFFLQLQKLVLSPTYDGPGSRVSDYSARLLLGEPGGGKLLGEYTTVPAHLKNDRLWWTSIQHEAEVRRYLAYSLLDGNGAKRAKRFQQTADGPISPYVRPLTCKLHQPKTKQHDDLLLPAPEGWPPTYLDRQQLKAIHGKHETWCLDDWFPAQPHACWVVREAEDSKPIQESFLLMPASEKSDRPVFFIALFAETEPKRLIAELAKLYQVSPDATLNSPETLERLNSLYEQVRDFPLAK